MVAEQTAVPAEQAAPAATKPHPHAAAASPASSASSASTPLPPHGAAADSVPSTPSSTRLQPPPPAQAAPLPPVGKQNAMPGNQPPASPTRHKPTLPSFSPPPPASPPPPPQQQQQQPQPLPPTELADDTDLYALLQVRPDVSPPALRKAYYRLALRWHPDKHTAATTSPASPGRSPSAYETAQQQEAAHRFHALRAAFEILQHPVRRQVYDAGRYVSLHDLRRNPVYDRPDFDIRWHLGPLSAMMRNTPPGRSSWSPSAASSTAPPSARGPFPPPPSASVPFAGSNNLHAENLPRASRRATAPASAAGTLPSDLVFGPRGPSGPAPASAEAASSGPQSPSRTTAEDIRSQTSFMHHPPPPIPPSQHVLSVPLERLYTGFEEQVELVRRVETAPGTWVDESVVLTIQGEAGWVAGTRITFNGAGDQPLSGPAADAVVCIEEEPHALFRRLGDDLYCQVRVPLLGALFGCTTDVPTISGESVHVAVDGARPGQEIRISGRGMRKLGATDHSCGDLIVSFQVSMPAYAAEPVPAEDEGRPTRWARIDLTCEACGQVFIQDENNQEACATHSGRLQMANGEPVAADDQDAFLMASWSCCQKAATAKGCQAVGAHVATQKSLEAAKTEAAFNALRILAVSGDAYQCAAQLLYCREKSLVAPAALAMQHSNFFALLILVRAGADMPHSQGLEAALNRAAEKDPYFTSRLMYILEQDPDMLDIMVRMPGACRVAYAYACHHTKDCALARALLQHPRVGPSRCGALKQRAATSTVLYRSLEQADEICARLLLAAGYPADGDDSDETSKFVHAHHQRRVTPLIAAIEANQPLMVELLLRHGADPDRPQNVYDEEGEILLDCRSPLTIAVQSGNTALVALLLQAGADVDWCNPVDRRTPLHLAAKLGDSLTVRLLVAAGARTNEPDIQGLRPIDLALEIESPRVIAALQQAIVREALQSMDGLTVVRLLYEATGLRPSRAISFWSADDPAGDEGQAEAANVDNHSGTEVVPDGELSGPNSRGYDARPQRNRSASLSQTGKNGAGDRRSSHSSAGKGHSSQPSSRRESTEGRESRRRSREPAGLSKADVRAVALARARSFSQESSRVRANLVVLEAALRSLCKFSAGVAKLPSPPGSVRSGSRDALLQRSDSKMSEDQKRTADGAGAGTDGSNSNSSSNTNHVGGASGSSSLGNTLRETRRNHAVQPEPSQPASQRARSFSSVSAKLECQALALRLYESWCETKDLPSESGEAGTAALLNLIEAGVKLKLQLQQQLEHDE